MEKEIEILSIRVGIFAAEIEGDYERADELKKEWKKNKTKGI